jgi:hypothetical protein
MELAVTLSNTVKSLQSFEIASTFKLKAKALERYNKGLKS